MKNTRVVFFVAILLAVAAGAFWYAWQKGYVGPRQARQQAVSTPVQVGGPFELVNHWGEPMTDADFRGQHMLVFFGYTYCPDVCPTTLGTIAAAFDELGAAAADVVPVFVTVDPERDTPEYLKEYLDHFHPAIIGLTGTPAQVKQAAKAYGVYYARVEDEASSDYLMDHTSLIYLMDEQGRYVTHFQHTVTADELARRLREIL